MAFITSLLLTQPTGFWPTIIFTFSKVGNYAWGIVLLTICIKLVMLPLDFFNKKVSKKNARMQAVLQPEMVKLQKQCGNDKNLYNQKLSELYKKNNFNIMGSCIFMLVNLVLTLVIFLTLWSSLNGIANYKFQDQYYKLRDTYNQTIITSTATTDEEKEREAQQAVIYKYDEVKDSWLWIDNIWKPETPWTNSVPTFDEYLGLVGNKVEVEKLDEEGNVILDEEGNVTYEFVLFKDLSEEKQTAIKEEYNKVMTALREEKGRANGYLILTILAIGTALFSQFLMQHRVGKKNAGAAQAQPTNKVLMIIMPLILGLFTLFYNSVFGIYIIVSQMIAIATSPLIDLILDKVDRKTEKKNEVVVEYSRKK